MNCERSVRKTDYLLWKNTNPVKSRRKLYFSCTIQSIEWKITKSLLFDLTPHLWYAFLCTFKQLSNVWKIYDTVMVFLNLSATSCYATLNKLVHIHTHLYFHRQRIRQRLNSVLFFLVHDLQHLTWYTPFYFSSWHNKGIESISKFSHVLLMKLT